MSLLALACSESVESPTSPVAPAAHESGPHFLSWNTEDGPIRFSALQGSEDGETAIVPDPRYQARLSSEETLETYQASFWALGEGHRYIQINYQAGENGQVAPFMRLDVQEVESVPGIGELQPGDSVLITVTVNPETLRVDFAPDGLVFEDQDPEEMATLTMWYSGAGGDYNSDNTVDASDSDIEPDLSIWMQSGVSPWTSLSSDQSTSAEWVSTLLQHFSGYAVSW